jgi:hypothetical protein
MRASAATAAVAVLVATGCVHTRTQRVTRDVPAARTVEENGAEVEVAASAEGSGSLRVTVIEHAMCRDLERGKREPVELKSTEPFGCTAHPFRCLFAPVAVPALFLIGFTDPYKWKALGAYFTCNESHVRVEYVPLEGTAEEYAEWRGPRVACAGSAPRPAAGLTVRATAEVDGHCRSWTVRTDRAGVAILHLARDTGSVPCASPAPAGVVRVEAVGLPDVAPGGFAPTTTARPWCASVAGGGYTASACVPSAACRQGCVTEMPPGCANDFLPCIAESEQKADPSVAAALCARFADLCAQAGPKDLATAAAYRRCVMRCDEDPFAAP